MLRFYWVLLHPTVLLEARVKCFPLQLIAYQLTLWLVIAAFSS